MIQKGDFIRITYTGRLGDENGDVFDTTDEQVARDNGIYNEDYTYGGEKIIVGAGHTLEGLDEEVVGKEVGYSGTVTIPPEKGFGVYDASLIKSYNISQFKQKPEVGTQVQIEGRYGVVHRVIGRRVQVDFNNPLAGKQLYYTYKIEEKIDDELEKTKGLVQLYTKEILDVKIENSIAIIDIPLKIAYTPQWVLSKRNLAEDIIKYTSVEEVVYTETYNRNTIKINP
jgi:FKBP-type peptidyl-prolyl cis-trans isomerase SlyD